MTNQNRVSSVTSECAYKTCFDYQVWNKKIKDRVLNLLLPSEQKICGSNLQKYCKYNNDVRQQGFP